MVGLEMTGRRMIRSGEIWRGWLGLEVRGMDRQDNMRCGTAGVTRPGQARTGTEWSGMAGRARQGMERFDPAGTGRYGTVRCDEVRRAINMGEKK